MVRERKLSKVLELVAASEGDGDKESVLVGVGVDDDHGKRRRPTGREFLQL